MQRTQWVKPPGHVPFISACCIEPKVKLSQINASTGDSSELICCGWTRTAKAETCVCQALFHPEVELSLLSSPYHTELAVLLSVFSISERSQGQAIVMCWALNRRQWLCWSKSPTGVFHWDIPNVYVLEKLHLPFFPCYHLVCKMCSCRLCPEHPLNLLWVHCQMFILQTDVITEIESQHEGKQLNKCLWVKSNSRLSLKMGVVGQLALWPEFQTNQNI